MCFTSYLDHAVAVGIGDVRLQTRKQGSVVMFEVKVLQSKFGVFYRDLIKHFHLFISHVAIHTNERAQYHGDDNKCLLKNVPFYIFSAPCRGVALHRDLLVIQAPGCNCHNLAQHL